MYCHENERVTIVTRSDAVRDIVRGDVRGGRVCVDSNLRLHSNFPCNAKFRWLVSLKRSFSRNACGGKLVTGIRSSIIGYINSPQQ